MSCNICVEDFNKSTRKMIECRFCEYQACKECCKKYILDIYQDAHCMNCKNLLDWKTGKK